MLLLSGDTALHVAAVKGHLEMCLEIDKGLRRYRRLQVLWMSSNLCIDDSNILNLLPVDLCRSVSNFIWFVRVHQQLYLKLQSELVTKVGADAFILDSSDFEDSCDITDKPHSTGSDLVVVDATSIHIHLQYHLSLYPLALSVFLYALLCVLV